MVKEKGADSQACISLLAYTAAIIFGDPCQDDVWSEELHSYEDNVGGEVEELHAHV